MHLQTYIHTYIILLYTSKYIHDKTKIGIQIEKFVSENQMQCNAFQL